VSCFSESGRIFGAFGSEPIIRRLIRWLGCYAGELKVLQQCSGRIPGSELKLQTTDRHLPKQFQHTAALASGTRYVSLVSFLLAF
jgi:hypothetical protein